MILQFFDGATKIAENTTPDGARANSETHWKIDATGRGSFDYFEFDSFDAGTQTVKFAKITRQKFRADRGLG